MMMAWRSFCGRGLVCSIRFLTKKPPPQYIISAQLLLFLTRIMIAAMSKPLINTISSNGTHTLNALLINEKFINKVIPSKATITFI